MATSVSKLKTVLTAEDKASAVFKKMAGSMKKMGKSAALAGAAVAAGIGAGLLFSIKKAADFEKAMNRVGAITGATGKEFEALRKEAKLLGITTAFSATQAAEGMQALAQKGFTTTQVIASMKGVLDLAAGSQMEVGETAEIAAGILNTFNLSASNSQRVMDSLAFASINSGSNVREFGEAMKFVGPAAQSLGVPMEEVIAALGVLGDRSITGSLAGTALGSSMTRLAKPTKAMGVEMKKLGVDFFDADGEFVGIQGTVSQLEKAFVGLTSEQKAAAISTIFGARAVKQWSTLVDAGAGKLGAFTKEIEGSSGAADRLAKGQLKGLSGALTILKSGLEGAAIAVGDKINPSLLRMTEKFQKLFQPTESFGTALAKISGKSLEELNDAMTPEQVDAFGQAWKLAGDDVDEFNAVLNELGQGDVIDGFDELGIGIEDIMQSFSAADESLSPFETGLNKIMESFKSLQEIIIPFIPSIEDVRNAFISIGENPQVIAFFEALKTQFFAFIEIVTPLGQKLMEIGQVVIPLLGEMIVFLMEKFVEIQPTLESLLEVWGRVWGLILDANLVFVEWFKNEAWPIIQQVINDIITNWELLWTVLQPIITNMVNFIRENWDTIKNYIEGILNVILGIFETVWAFISGNIKIFLAVIQGDWSGAMDAMKEMNSRVWEGIKRIISGAWEAIKAFFSLHLANIQKGWSSAWDKIKATLADIWGGIKEKVRDGVENIVGFFTDLPSKLVAGLSGLGAKLGNKLKSELKEASGPIGGAVSGIVGLFNKNQSGTTFSPGGPTLVGEQGPELVNLPRGSKVTPNTRAQRTIDNSKSGNTVVFNISGADPRSIAQEVKAILDRDLELSSKAVA